jgi:hypothetical protein
MTQHVKMNIEGQEFVCSPRQAVAIETLLETRKGGFARINGYVSKTNVVTPGKADVTILSRFDILKLYERKINFLENLTLDAIADDVAKDDKLKLLSKDELQEAFNDRKAQEIASMTKTLEGVREDAHRQGHDRCYVRLGAGVKGNYVTEKNSDGIAMPVLNNGLPVLKTILINGLEISKKIITEATYKPVNSGVPVRLSNIMEKHAPKTTRIKMYSLNDDNFESLTIDGETIYSEDV